MKSQLQTLNSQLQFWKTVFHSFEARGYNLMPLDNSINCSETNVTFMPQITGDAVYSGSDLFNIVIYNNELS